MKILAIETSCDETSAAIIENGTKILSNIISSSQSLHNKTGGIIPEIAAREQIKYIIPVIAEALKKGLQKNRKKPLISLLSEIDCLAVTVGPGLIGSLLVGVETAKTISFITGKKIIPVNHIHAHMYANWITGAEIPEFPLIALIVSGGHTELFFMKNHGSIKWIGGTRDDAAGEAFDKTARLLNLGYPGGPAIASAANKFNVKKSRLLIRLPRPIIDSKDLDFSFSGLKTAVMREFDKLKAIGQLNNDTVAQLSYEIQESITDILIKKTLDAARQFKVKTIILGGGVAANRRLTEKFNLEIGKLKSEINLYIPPPQLCTDNAAYIGSFAFFHNKSLHFEKIQAMPDLPVEV